MGLRGTYGTGLTGAANLLTADTTAPILYWYVVTSGGTASLHYQRSDGQSRLYPVTTSSQVNIDNPTTGNVAAHATSGTLLPSTGRLIGMAPDIPSAPPVPPRPCAPYPRGCAPHNPPPPDPSATP